MAGVGFLGTGEIAAAMVSTVAGDGHMAVAARWLTAFNGHRVSAQACLAALLGGHCRFLGQSANLDPEALRKGLSSEGGLNQTLSRRLSENEMLETLEAGLDSFRERLQRPQKS